jgi:hypothetical protein
MCTNCEEKECIRANLTRDLELKWKLEPPGKTFNNTNQHNRVHASMFEQNIKVYLAIQQCGGGRHGSKILGGMFGLHSNALQNSWMRISEKVGLAILELGLEVLSENREVEKVLSPEKNGKPAISLCGDARWDKRSSGRNYSSLYGCSLAVGCRSQLAWDVKQMSNACIKCVRNIEHDKDARAQNVTYSTNAMEALGSAKIITRIWEGGGCFVNEYVGDNESSTKKMMKHSYADLVRDGKLKEWPRYVGTQNKKDRKPPTLDSCQ